MQASHLQVRHLSKLCYETALGQNSCFVTSYWGDSQQVLAFLWSVSSAPLSGDNNTTFQSVTGLTEDHAHRAGATEW